MLQMTNVSGPQCKSDNTINITCKFKDMKDTIGDEF